MAVNSGMSCRYVCSQHTPTTDYLFRYSFAHWSNNNPSRALRSQNRKRWTSWSVKIANTLQWCVDGKNVPTSLTIQWYSFCVWFQVVWHIYSLVQVFPLPLNPRLHRHRYEPSLLLHVAFGEHGSDDDVHSFISVRPKRVPSRSNGNNFYSCVRELTVYCWSTIQLIQTPTSFYFMRKKTFYLKPGSVSWPFSFLKKLPLEANYVLWLERIFFHFPSG